VSSDQADATASSTNTDMHPDQPRQSFGHPQGHNAIVLSVIWLVLGATFVYEGFSTLAD
jgi:hypothetical protein